MLINFLQAIYDNNTPLPSDTEIYHQLKGDIEYFSISPQVYSQLKQQNQLDKTPLLFQNQLKESYNQVLLQNLFIKNQTKEILNAFDDLAIEAIPLKGVFFSEKYFGDLAARGTSDIDLLIMPSDLRNAIESVKKLGYIVEEECSPNHFHCSFSKELPGSAIPLSVEIHWNILKEDTSNLNIEEFWNEAIPMSQYSHIKELSDYHTFYFICLHAWRHNLDSMKHFIDIVQMVHVLGDSLDLDSLFRDATSHKTLKRMERTLSIVYHVFPHLEEIKKLPINKRTGLWWQYEAIKSSTYRNVKVYADFFDYQFFSFDTVRHRFLAFSQWISPTRNDLMTELGFEIKSKNLLIEYSRLYKRRFLGVVKSMKE
ncbi:nucleotidyltransferase family protein [Metabacillus herbersteinensis]|uniref:Nucleotidyltransferase family protein n=1 Tax=Metabacillus herbersteinensis TaxID=283816 RepID=A0ABV6G8D3_9BACI